MLAAPRVSGAFAERLGGGSGNGSGSSSYGAADDGAGDDPSETLVSESRPLIDAAAGEGSLGSLGSRGSGPGTRGRDDAVPDPAGPAGLGPEGEPFRLPDAVKLGLGDFIFYSVLVSRAAMYDVFAMLACYFAIIQGLIFTLLLLGLAQKALPALPISIALGVVTYVGTRYAFEPVTQQLLQKGLYF
jgi:presenilin 1